MIISQGSLALPFISNITSTHCFMWQGINGRWDFFLLTHNCFQWNFTDTLLILSLPFGMDTKQRRIATAAKTTSRNQMEDFERMGFSQAELAFSFQVHQFAYSMCTRTLSLVFPGNCSNNKVRGVTNEENSQQILNVLLNTLRRRMGSAGCATGVLLFLEYWLKL